jgi:hypothetical protein
VPLAVRNALGQQVFDPVTEAPLFGSTSGEDIWEARLRIQRDF